MDGEALGGVTTLLSVAVTEGAQAVVDGAAFGGVALTPTRTDGA